MNNALCLFRDKKDAKDQRHIFCSSKLLLVMLKKYLILSSVCIFSSFMFMDTLIWTSLLTLIFYHQINRKMSLAPPPAFFLLSVYVLNHWLLRLHLRWFSSVLWVELCHSLPSSYVEHLTSQKVALSGDSLVAFLEVMSMLIILTVVMVSRVYVYVKIITLYILNVQSFYCTLIISQNCYNQYKYKIK